jgi:hypothetical protein
MDKGPISVLWVGMQVCKEKYSQESVRQYTETLKAIADYVGQEYKHGRDIRYMIKNMTDYVLVRPQDPMDNASQFEIE